MAWCRWPQTGLTFLTWPHCLTPSLRTQEEWTFSHTHGCAFFQLLPCLACGCVFFYAFFFLGVCMCSQPVYATAFLYVLTSVEVEWWCGVVWCWKSNWGRQMSIRGRERGEVTYSIGPPTSYYCTDLLSFPRKRKRHGYTLHWHGRGEWAGEWRHGKPLSLLTFLTFAHPPFPPCPQSTLDGDKK